MTRMATRLVGLTSLWLHRPLRLMTTGIAVGVIWLRPPTPEGPSGGRG